MDKIPTLADLGRGLVTGALAQIAMSSELRNDAISVAEYGIVSQTVEWVLAGEVVAVDPGSAAADGAAMAALLHGVDTVGGRSFTRHSGAPGWLYYARTEAAGEDPGVVNLAVVLGAPKATGARVCCWGWRLIQEGTQAHVRADTAVLLPGHGLACLDLWEEHAGVYHPEHVRLWRQGFEQFRAPWGERARGAPEQAPEVPAGEPAQPERQQKPGILDRLLRGYSK